MKSGIIIAIVFVLGILGYIVFLQPNSTAPIEETKDETEEVLEEETEESKAEETTEGESMMEDEGATKEGEEGSTMKPTTEEETQTPPPSAEEEAPIISHTMTFDGQAYSPNVLNVKKGDTVTWVNESDRMTWPASAVHPIHTVYPTTGGCIGSTLDACKALENGESFSFTFDEVGAWKMHDHRAPFIKMTVVVAE